MWLTTVRSYFSCPLIRVWCLSVCSTACFVVYLYANGLCASSCLSLPLPVPLLILLRMAMMPPPPPASPYTPYAPRKGGRERGACKRNRQTEQTGRQAVNRPPVKCWLGWAKLGWLWVSPA
ncbi:hypothetical protein BKA80DRAFT_106890 [Phyllosticta citrichinensis]